MNDIPEVIDQLMPCPFCGAYGYANLHLEESIAEIGGASVWVVCGKCGCYGGVGRILKEEILNACRVRAVEAWNTRKLKLNSDAQEETDHE